MKTLTHDVSVGKSQGKENVINIRRRIFFNHDINSIEEEQVKETPKNKHKTRKLINLRIFNQMTQNAKNFRSKEKEKTKAESKISIEKYIKQSMINYKNLVNKTFESTLNTYLKGFDSMQTIPNSTRSNQTNPSSIFKSHTKSDNLKIRDIQNLNNNISSKGKSLLGKMTAVYNDCKEATENKVRIIDSLCIDSFCNSKLSSNLMNSSNLITSGNTNSHKTRLIVENKSLFDSLGCRNQDPLLSNAYGYKCKYMNSNTLKSNRAIVNPIKARNAKQPNFMLFHKVRKEYLLEKENKKNLKARQKRALKIKGAESENH